MPEGKEFLIELLESHSREAITLAKRMRATAAKQPTRKEAEVYLQQACFEERKSAGYLRQVEILCRT